jgi:pilus assembly protein CpaC
MNNVTPNMNKASAKSRRNRILTGLGISALGVFLMVGGSIGQEVRPGAQQNQGAIVAEGLNKDGQVSLMLNTSAVITTRRAYDRVSIANPDIVADNLIGPNSILLTAKKPGRTQLIVWDASGQSQAVDVIVDVDLAVLQKHLDTVFPNTKIEVTAMNDAIALRGRVPSLQVSEQALQIAAPYSAKVMNLMEVSGGQQVMLQVRFAEVSRTASTALGFNAFGTDGTASFGSLLGPGGDPIGGVAANNASTTIDPAVTLLGRGTVGAFTFEYFIEALRSNSLLRILAEPNLVAISGQEADFLAGGEFPIPVPSAGSNSLSIEYREFGVRLKFVPVVLGDGRIRLKLSPEVSDLDFGNAVNIAGTRVPALRKRTLTTTVEMAEGQTFAVGGLLDSNTFSSKDAIPLLGDLPVVGTLFRSTRYQRRETELVILVTPFLVEPMNPAQVPPAPGEKWRHPSEAELFWNRDLGGPVECPTTRPTGPAPRFRGEYGFTTEAAEPQAVVESK